MKVFLATIFILLIGQTVFGQDTLKIAPKQEIVKKADNYTVQYLIIYNDKGEVLLQKITQAGTLWDFVQTKINQ